jgi:DNA polymerase-3 subunit delta
MAAVKAARLDQLQTHLQRDSLAPVYLLAGQEPLLLLEAADAVRAAARRQGFTERQVLEAGEGGFDWSELAASSQQGSLFGGDRRLIDLRLPGGKPGKVGAEALKEWASAVPDDTVLLITCTQWGKAWEVAWVDAISRSGWYVPVWPLKRDELPRWIAQRSQSRGLVLAEDAVQLLADRTEGNLLACAQEIDKLVLLGDQGSLGAAQLEAVLAEQARLDVFALTDAVLAGNASRATRILHALRAESEQPVPILSWLGSQVELLARAADAESEGRPVAQALRAERVWENRMPLYQRALARIRGGGCRRALLTLARLDRMAKGRETGDVWLETERLLLRLAGSGRARAPVRA